MGCTQSQYEVSRKHDNLRYCKSTKDTFWQDLLHADALQQEQERSEATIHSFLSPDIDSLERQRSVLRSLYLPSSACPLEETTHGLLVSATELDSGNVSATSGSVSASTVSAMLSPSQESPNNYIYCDPNSATRPSWMNNLSRETPSSFHHGQLANADNLQQFQQPMERKRLSAVVRRPSCFPRPLRATSWQYGTLWCGRDAGTPVDQLLASPCVTESISFDDEPASHVPTTPHDFEPRARENKP